MISAIENLPVSGGVKMYEKRRFENADKIKSYLPGSRLMPAA